MYGAQERIDRALGVVPRDEVAQSGETRQRLGEQQPAEQLGQASTDPRRIGVAPVFRSPVRREWAEKGPRAR
jgi:hypothetical protein